MGGCVLPPRGGRVREHARLQRGEARERLEVTAAAAHGDAPEARHAFFDVHGEADAGELAVACDVDARVALLDEDVVEVVRQLLAECDAVDGLAGFESQQQVEQRRAARQAADMRGQDAIATTPHRCCFIGRFAHRRSQ